MARKTAQEIDAEAAAWVTRLDREPLSLVQQMDLDAWLAEDLRQLGAFGRMRAIAQTTERAQVLGTGREIPIASSNSRRRFLIGAGVASAASLLITPIAWKTKFRASPFQTAKGETKVLALKDGSVVTLNTSSEILIDYTEDKRRVRLVRGEVLFNVAHDRKRPFIVLAGDTQVQVVGTSFTIRHLDTQPVQVLVREGIVDISKPSDPAIPVLRISANTRAIAKDNQIAIDAHPVPPAELHRELAWQDGRIAFEGQTLEQAASEFSRYSDIRIRIDDPRLAKEEIVGLFDSNDPVGFAQTVAVSLNVKAEVGEGVVTLSR